ncbi:Carbohydrate-binding protein [Phytophthora palmivora]|uniref:Carbohydrate-binding protein n=1 Tax=Phytophthora palmivora TaxID=4796 RepID=A0A2P4X936_9STRA|nr:Carbohydrate-binding protein [Phytophthora palmivora]
MAMPVMALAGGDTYFTGDGTSYTLGQVSSGNCNFMYDPGVGNNYAALNSAQWDSTLNCGRCAEVSCDDSRCSDTTSTQIVYLVDRCPECQEGDLDLSPTVFKTLTGSDPSRYSIKWKFVNCPVSGNIEYCTKSGSSSHWLAVQPANFANGVASMKIANQDLTMVDSCYYFLLNGGANIDMNAVNIELTSISGETITETLSLSADNCTEGTANSSQTQSQTQQSEVTNYFNSLTTNSSSSSDNAYKAGKVIAANESGSGVSILQSSEAGVEKTPSTQQQQQDDESDNTSQTAGSDTKQVSTKSASEKGTSPVLVALIVLAAVGGIALAAVAYTVKKKKLDDKRIDRDEALLRSFDTFSSPICINETNIAKI